MNRDQIITAVRSQDNLNDSGTIWTAANLNNIFDNVLAKVSQRKALQREACLPITGKAIDISSLTRLIKIYRIQTPLDDDPKINNRNYTSYGTSVKLDLRTAPTIVAGTLTGTVTFTKGSQAVTGSGTLFTTELSVGMLIGFSSGSKFYLISSITSVTALTLDLPFEEETGADTVSVTKYRDGNSVARVYYGKEYTVTRGPVAFYGTGLNDLVAGTSFSGAGEIAYKVQIDGTGTPNTFKWSDDGGATWDGTTVNCSTSAIALNNSMSISFGTTTGHTLGDYWTFVARANDLPDDAVQVLIDGVVACAATEWAALLSAAETSLLLPNLASTGDLTTGRTKIDSLNLGGAGVAPTYAQYAQVDVAVAQAQVIKMREYKTWADMRMGMYQRGLAGLIRLSDHVAFSCARD
jgi:hypothetical protein